MEGKRVLVTGGAGFIGATLANALADDNEVVAVDDLFLGTPDHLNPDVEFVEADVVSDDLPTDVDVLVHLAALSSRTMLEERPQRGARVNVEGFVNAVETVRDACDTVVFASTSSFYDDPPAREDDDVVASTHYEASMLARERYMEQYNATADPDDLSVAGLRFFSVYQGMAGAEGHKGGYANTVSQFADQVANGESPVLWGDGEQTRDFTHVDDVVAAVEAVADARLRGVYNVGYGESYSFNETVALINEVLGTDVDPVYEPIPLDNYNHDQRCDNAKLREATGWAPRIDFETGLRRLCAPYLD
jgi:UDP-glucose 4-epimerase